MNRYILILVLFSGKLFSQQESFYSLYQFNMQVINPAYAGAEGDQAFTLLNRSQWASIENAPKTTAFTYSSVRKKSVGLGISVVSDNVFVEQQTFAYVDFSYQLKMSEESSLYLGLKAGGNFYKSDPTGLTSYSNGNDPAQRVLNQFNPNIGAGAYYQSEKYWVSFSIPRLFNTNRDNDLVVTAKDRVHTYLGAGMLYKLNDIFSLKPSLMYRKVKGLPGSVDLTSFISYQNYFELGMSYRTNASTAILAVFKPLNGLKIGYAYETPAEQTLSGISLKTHEIVLKINLGDIVHSKVVEEEKEVEENQQTN